MASQFDKIGLKPAGTSGYLQPVKFETRLLVADQSSLALLRGDQEQPIVLGQEATLSSRASWMAPPEAPMYFVGYGMSIPEAHWDDLAGVDLRGQDRGLYQRSRAGRCRGQRQVSFRFRRGTMGRAEEGRSDRDRNPAEPESAALPPIRMPRPRRPAAAVQAADAAARRAAANLRPVRSGTAGA